MTILLSTISIILTVSFITTLVNYIKLKKKHAELRLKHNITVRYADALSVAGKNIKKRSSSKKGSSASAEIDGIPV